MKIADPCVVALVWTLRDAQGELIDTLSEPIEFFFRGDDLLEAVETAIDGQSAGFAASLHLEPEQAFGDYDAALVCFEPRELFGKNLVEGMNIEGLPEGARTADMPPERIYTVTEIYEDHVVLDGNHPLAGLALNLDFTIVAVRAASPQELQARAVESPILSVLLPPRDRPTMH